ncbi:YgaP family membrane protein [Carboxydothermus pertinax]|uniref:Inner membrane protein YgaP-like transmembrane domain-containing protein n=1 Tax=Carboxydothermus pertinax TaxID=870242 RepID=A0A1L8CY79_9THEO|nr:DUF2892 domain-containing protein [Carboxydothermus pertinax]GAV23819.1 hypothetical protein cpu_23290 [Carboxydothermus pertinax]
MRENVGTWDAFLRSSMGAMLLGLGIVNKSKNLICVGAMELATGITRWCPVFELFGINTVEENNWYRENGDDDEFSIPSPS